MVILGEVIGVKGEVSTDQKRRWQALESAARHLDVDPSTLRKRAERHCKVGQDGVPEAKFDGLRLRKFGARWKVQLSSEWEG